ncbi:Myosin heavy chain-related protein, partial [Thalictrum thalictroides]
MGISLLVKESMERDLASPIIISEGTGDSLDALALALKEKVAALLLLSQQDERHLLERNATAAIQKKMEELQRNLQQVTNEKVKALMELAQHKQDYQILQEMTQRVSLVHLVGVYAYLDSRRAMLQ